VRSRPWGLEAASRSARSRSGPAESPWSHRTEPGARVVLFPLPELLTLLGSKDRKLLLALLHMLGEQLLLKLPNLPDQCGDLPLVRVVTEQLVLELMTQVAELGHLVLRSSTILLAELLELIPLLLSQIQLLKKFLSGAWAVPAARSRRGLRRRLRDQRQGKSGDNGCRANANENCSDRHSWNLRVLAGREDDWPLSASCCD
jgi:hypothetical protein